MLTSSSILAETTGRTKVNPDDIAEVDKLFFDGKANARMLANSI